jgi:hypothetical protein
MGLALKLIILLYLTLRLKGSHFHFLFLTSANKLKAFFILLSFLYYPAQNGRKLGDECIPGTCASLNSNCKWQGTLFKCVCKDKHVPVNQTHCGNNIFGFFCF